MALRLRSMLLLGVLFATATGYYHLEIFLPRAQAVYAAKGLGNGYFFGGDLYPIWRTAREWRLHRFDPYSSAMTASIQTGLFGRPLDAHNPLDPPWNYREFSYPAFVDILALPSTWLPFPVVRVAGASIMFLMTVVGIVLWTGILELRFSPAQWTIVFLLTMFSYPVLEGLAAVQLGLLVSVLLAASMAALRRGMDLSAGWLLALTMIKPQMTVLVIGCLFVWALSEWRQRWRFVGGLFGGGAVLSLSATLISTSWLRQWLHVLLGYGHYSQPPLPVYLFGLPAGKALSFVLLAVAALLGWCIRHMPAKSSEFILTIACLLAISVVVLLPGQAVYDHILLLPGVLLLLKFEDESVLRTAVGRFTLALTGTAIGWYWIAAVVVVAVSFLAGSLSDAWVLLPVRTASSIPFAVLACLGLLLRSRGLPILRGATAIST